MENSSIRNNKNTQNQPSLKDVFKDDFDIGVALNLDQISGKEQKTTALVEKHFNSITPENILKWEEVHPEPDRYHFEPVDCYVAFGEKNKMHIIGHTLVWFHQTPDWVFRDESGKPPDREVLLKRMKEHIFTVMGRYKGRIHGWDVVNEAIVPDGQFRKCKWLDIIGEDYVLKAFEYARQADPDAELYYNDYNFYRGRQCETVIRLIQSLQSSGVRLDGIGIQGHWGLDYPGYEQIENIIGALSKLGVKLMITELDVTVLPFAEDYLDKKLTSLDPGMQMKLNPYANALPESVQKEQAKRYAEYFSIFLKHRDKFKRVTFWGIHDRQSWRSDWPVIGRTDYPLLFDSQCEPKPALDAIIQTGLSKK
jgi:endo-1,4-beta-xylanase